MCDISSGAKEGPEVSVQGKASGSERPGYEGKGAAGFGKAAPSGGKCRSERAHVAGAPKFFLICDYRTQSTENPVRVY